MNSDEYKMLSQEINELHERLDGHDKYLKEMTTALSFVSVLLVIGFLNLYGVI
tara:strand:- start:395 stop:553 length:159 start_codon:yes stop_codon:yes gene_type:complete